MKIKELSGGPMVTLSKNQRLSEAAEMMKRLHGTGVPVVDEDDRLVGLVTIGDIMHLAHDGADDAPAVDSALRAPIIPPASTAAWPRMKIGAIMTTDVVTATPEEDSRVVARRMVEKAIHHIVVIDEDRRPAAMLTAFDFVHLHAAGDDASLLKSWRRWQ